MPVDSISPTPPEPPATTPGTTEKSRLETLKSAPTTASTHRHRKLPPRIDDFIKSRELQLQVPFSLYEYKSHGGPYLQTRQAVTPSSPAPPLKPRSGSSGAAPRNILWDAAKPDVALPLFSTGTSARRPVAYRLAGSAGSARPGLTADIAQQILHQGTGGAAADGGPGSSAFVPLLFRRLEEAQATPDSCAPDRPAPLATVTRQTRTMLLVQAFVRAGVDAASLEPVLQKLQDAALYRLQAAVPADPLDRLALQVAQLLSRSTAGFAALCALAPVQALEVDGQGAGALHIKLQSGDYLRAHAHEKLGPAHPARLAWAAATQRLLGQPLTPLHKLAFFNWTQAVTDGGGAAFSHMQASLHKFRQKTIHRTGPAGSLKTHALRLLGMRQGPLRAATLSDPAKMPLQKDSLPGEPVAPAEPQTPLQPVKQRYQQAVRAVLATRAMKLESVCGHVHPLDGLLELAALHQWLDRGTPRETVFDNATLRDIARRAFSLCRPDRPVSAHLAEPLRTLQAVTAAWQRMSPDQLWESAGFSQLAGQDLTAAGLSCWPPPGQDAGADFSRAIDRLRLAEKLLDAAKDAEAARGDGPEDAALAEPLPTAASETDTCRDILLGIVRNLRTTSRVRLVDRHTCGISTKKVSNAVSTALWHAGSPLTPHLDLSASRSRDSVVEISRQPDGIAIFIGTTKSSAQKVTVGAHLGYQVEIGTVLQGKVGAALLVMPVNHELIEPQGLVIRIARKPLDDGSSFDDETMYQKALGVVEHLFSGAGDTPHASPQADWNRLAQRYWNEADISVGCVSGASSHYSAGVLAQAGAKTHVSHFDVEAELFVRMIKTFHDRNSVRETGRRGVSETRLRSGSFLEYGATVGLQYRGSSTDDGPAARAGAAALAPEPPADRHEEAASLAPAAASQAGGGPAPAQESTARPGESNPQVSSNPASAKPHVLFSVLHADTSRMASTDKSHSKTYRLATERDELVALACVLDVEFKNRQAWTRALRSGLDGWVDAVASQMDVERGKLAQTHRSQVPTPARRREEALARLSDYAATVKANERPHDSYVLRYRLRETVAARINANTAFMKGLPERGHEALRARLAADSEALLHDPRSWIEAELKVKQKAYKIRRFGLNFVVQNQGSLQLESERDWSHLKLSLAALRQREAAQEAAGDAKDPLTP